MYLLGGPHEAPPPKKWPEKRVKRGVPAQPKYVSPWRLTFAQAQAMDMLCVHYDYRVISRILGVDYRRIDNLLTNSFRKMRKAGLVFPDNVRVHAAKAWMDYWASDLGKAHLRNPTLTESPDMSSILG